jgi:callose synthase
VGNGNWMGKVNFVEIRSFWHIFRSFDRMWSFLILSLQVFNSLACSSSFGYSFFDAICFLILSCYNYLCHVYLHRL